MRQVELGISDPGAPGGISDVPLIRHNAYVQQSNQGVSDYGRPQLNTAV